MSIELKDDSKLNHWLEKNHKQLPVWQTVIGTIIAVLILVAFILSFQGVIIMLLWNWLVPVLFNGVTITFFQSVGLAVLTSVLLGVANKNSK